MKTRIVTVTNSFHGTSATFRAPANLSVWEAWGQASERTRSRLRRELCGANKGNCTCGVVRMPVQHAELDRGEDLD